MASGSVQTVLVCVPSSSTQAPCPSGMTVGTMQALVVDPAEQSYLDAISSPFDYTLAGQIWAFAFTSVLALYLVARSAGSVLEFIRRG